MPAPHADPQAEAVRANIRRHALELFSHFGFQKTNIGDIAERAGMSPGNLYRYYKNKQAIGVAVVAQYFELAQSATEAARLAVKDEPAEVRICAVLEAGITHILEELNQNPRIVELAEFICEDEAGLAVLQTHIDWKRLKLAEEIEAGIAEGTLQAEDPEGVACAILLALQSFSTPMSLIRWRDRSTILPEARMVLDLLFRGMRRADNPTAGTS